MAISCHAPRGCCCCAPQGAPVQCVGIHRRNSKTKSGDQAGGSAYGNCGHKRQHVQKFQAIMTPFGIMVHLYGPIEGQRHDARILRMTGLLDQLAQHIPRRCPNPDDVFVLYGDSAYPLRAYLQAPFGGAHKTPAERQFNSLMSKSRICVEWVFCDISAKFGIVDHKRNQ